MCKKWQVIANVTVWWLALLLHIQESLSSNLEQETDCSDLRLLQLKIGHTFTLLSSLYCTIHCHKIWLCIPYEVNRALLSKPADTKSWKVHSNMEKTYFSNIFFVILHTWLALKFIYCWFKPCSRTEFISSSH